MVYAHLTIPQNLHGFIAFRMPLFFFVAGYLFSSEKQTFTNFIQKKIRRIIIPYFFFSFISFLFWYFILTKFNPHSYQDTNAIQYLIGIFCAIPDKNFIFFNIPLWFLPCLFVIHTLYFFISKIPKKGHQFLISVLLFALGIIINKHFSVRIPWAIDVALCSVVFFMLGNYCRGIKLFDKFIFSLSKTKQLFLALSVFILFLITAYLNSKDNYVVVYQLELNNYFLYFINGIFGIIFIFMISNFLSNEQYKNLKKFFAFYGKNTLIILCTHLIIVALIKGFLLMTTGTKSDYFEGSFSRNLLLFSGVIIMLIPTIILVRKYLWFILGISKNKS